MESEEIRVGERVKELIMPRSKFVKVTCRKCRNEQVIFNKVSTVVKCLKCQNELATPTGGDAEIKGKVTKSLM